jgi:hypothetical protein
MRYEKFKVLFDAISGRAARRVSDRQIAELEDDVRRLSSSAPPAVEPADAYWQNLAVRINERIDRETSGRALSLAWAARVALPGVIAVVGVLTALHYYVPENPPTGTPVASVLASLPSKDLDSLLIDPSQVEPDLSVEELAGEVFVVSREQCADYLVASGNASAAVEELSKSEAGMLLASLETRHQ